MEAQVDGLLNPEGTVERQTCPNCTPRRSWISPGKFGKAEGRTADPSATVGMTFILEIKLSVPKQNCHPDRSAA